MTECFKCGATKDKAILFDVITRNGIAKICNACYKKEGFPLVKQGSEFPQKEEPVYDRNSWVKPKGIKRSSQEDELLKRVIDKNFQKSLGNPMSTSHLIDNFHWVIMRVRRLKHFTQKDFARELGEPELAIKMVEQGVLGDQGDALIKKIESYFGISLRKGIEIKKPEETKRELDFKDRETEELTISDLKELDEEREKVGKEGFWKSWFKRKSSEGVEEEKVGVETERELSEEEVDEILFGDK